jgi:hypothetical protein
MKSDHEQRGSSMSGEVVSRAAELLIDNSVKTLHQSGGIAAHTVNIHNYSPPSKTEHVLDSSPKGFAAAEPKNGQARFRLLDQPLGIHWDPMPYAGGTDHEIFLSTGPAMWLRVMPRRVTPERTWSVDELHTNATRGNLPLQPFSWTSLNYLRAEDGFGTYSTSGIRESETNSAAFAFETGEVWGVDTSLLSANSLKHLHFLAIAQALLKGLSNYGAFLHNLGVEPPFDWIAGLEEVKGWKLQLPTQNQGMFSGNSCLSRIITANGSYDLEHTPGVALRPFFNQLFRKCATQCPEFVKAFIEKPLP